MMSSAFAQHFDNSRPTRALTASADGERCDRTVDRHRSGSRRSPKRSVSTLRSSKLVTSSERVSAHGEWQPHMVTSCHE